jgi:hypothetical protein
LVCRDGKDDYAYIDDYGGLQVWHNCGGCDNSIAMDGIRLADVNSNVLQLLLILIYPVTDD